MTSVPPVPIKNCNPDLFVYRQTGSDHHAAGRWKEALAAFDAALKLCPDDSALLLERSQALQRLGRSEEALACIWKVLATDRGSPSLWLDAASVLFGLNRLIEARSVLHNAIDADARCARAWGVLGETLSKRGKEVAAEVCFRRNAVLAPGDALVRLRLAQWLTQAARYDEAIVFFEEARRLAPAALDAISGLAQIYISLGRPDEAEPLLQEVLDRDGQHLDACLGRARLLLLKGDFAAGWPAYETRRRRADIKLPKLTGPEWDGTPICGKTLVVYAEQGFGDVLQFLRYMPILNREGARVILLIPKELEALCQCLTLDAEIRSSLSGLPSYDFHIPLLSLAWRLGTNHTTIPAEIPYLSVEPSSKHRLPVPLGTRLKVGVVWAGRPTHANDRHRSVPLETLMPLAAVPGVSLYSLQAGPRTKDIHKEAHPVLVGDLSPHLKDFVDTALVIQQLDLVVAIDTSVAHLAGALGKPVWVLVPFAPDWRWLLNGETTAWYPTMRLFRQSEPLRWDDVIERIAAELRDLAATRPEFGGDGERTAYSVFLRPDGSPRYSMTTPHSFLSDAGIRYLFQRECLGIGYEYATRCFLDAHLRPGDLFIDVGAHWGIMSLHAATSCPDVSVLACEPTPRNLPHLRRWIDRNGLADKIEVIPAAIADRRGKGRMCPQSTMGHSLEKSVDGLIDVTTIDQLLDERPSLAGRRVIVKIDVEGSEADVIAGMAKLLATGLVAAVIWERGRTYDQAEGLGGVASIRAVFDRLGYSAWRFDSEDKAGPPVAFTDNGRIDNVFELAPSIVPLPSYQAERLPKDLQPADPIMATMERAQALFQNGLKLQAAGEIDKALSAYTHAGTLDRRSPDLFNNLGVALQRLGRRPAAEAAYRRALFLEPDNPNCLSNLGSVLREQGKLDEATKIHSVAVAKAPTSASILANAAHAFRDRGDLKEAQSLYERCLAAKPGNADISLDLARALLRQGIYHEGFRAYASCGPRTEQGDLTSEAWRGELLCGKSILLRDDGSTEDALQFSRFISAIHAKGAGRVMVSCRPSLIRLFQSMSGVESVTHSAQEAPQCDTHASFLQLPGLLDVRLEEIGKTDPYLTAGDTDLDLRDDQRLKIGLAWATTPFRKDVSCPIEELLHLFDNPAYSGFSLQQGPGAIDLEASGADDILRDLAPRMADFAETAAVLSKLDVVVTVDGPIAHLAGALGIETFVLLPFAADWRWLDTRSDSPWYPTLRLFRQPKPNDWKSAVKTLEDGLSDWKGGVVDKKVRKAPARKIKSRLRDSLPA